MPLAVLADIGGRALIAEIRGGTVLIGEGVGRDARAVIVEIADRIGQSVPISIGAVVAMVASRFRDPRQGDDDRKEGGGREKRQCLHLDSPKVPVTLHPIRRSTEQSSAESLQ